MSSLNMNYQFISLLLLSSCVYSEILTFTDSTPPVTDVIECQDATTECIINCNSTSICSNKELHCHATSQLSCTINLNANASATSATVYTHSSPTVHLNGNAVDCCHSMNVSAYEQGGTQLFVDSTFDGALQYAEIYGPVGFGSILWMKCSVYGCQNLRIYDDWSTTLRLEPTAIGAFKDSRVYNIFDSAGLGIARDDPNYNAADMDYRAPVYLLDCYGSQDAFVRVTIDGTNHGDWFVSGSGSYLWHYSTIYATTDDRVDQSIPYNVELYAANKLFPRFNFHAGAGADVLLDMEGGQALHTANIYAKSANSLTIYCNGGYCIHSNIECPDNTSPNSCNFVCESVAQCYGNDIEKPSTACDNLYLSSEMRDNKVYCGYDQTAAYCNYTSEGNNTVHSCSSGCGSPCAFDNAIVPTSIASKHTALCSETFITFPNTTTSTTPEPTTTTTSTTSTTTNNPESQEGKVKEEAEVEDGDDDDDGKGKFEFGTIAGVGVGAVFGILCCLCCLCVCVLKRYISEKKEVNEAKSNMSDNKKESGKGEETTVHVHKIEPHNYNGNAMLPAQPVVDVTNNVGQQEDSNYSLNGEASVEVDIDKGEGDDEELWNPHRMTTVGDGNEGTANHMTTTVGDGNETVGSPSLEENVLSTPQGQDTSGDIGEERVVKCSDCWESKMGSVYDGDGMFYCNDCSSLY